LPAPPSPAHRRKHDAGQSAIGIRGLKRPRCDSVPTSIPDERWFDSVLRHSPPKLAALVVFLTLSGRRVGEALALTEKDIDENGNAHIGRTKTGVPVVCRLPSLCLDLLSDCDGYYARKGVGQPSKRLFGYASLQSASVALRRTCERAGVPYYSFHKCGRHSFATRGLKAGKSIKWLQIAGGWKSHKSLDRYLHLEQSEVARDVEVMGQEWGKLLS
jgi:integrase